LSDRPHTDLSGVLATLNKSPSKFSLGLLLFQLNLLGLDNLADYSEFLFEQEVAIALRQPQMAVVVPSYYSSWDLPHHFIAAHRA
jgi:hypothetical protein